MVQLIMQQALQQKTLHFFNLALTHSATESKFKPLFKFATMDQILATIFFFFVTDLMNISQ